MPIIKFMCTYCGKRDGVWHLQGRPNPGKCPRNNNKPHHWVKI